MYHSPVTAKDPKAPVTNRDLDEALDAVLEGVGQLLDENLSKFSKVVSTRFDNLDTEVAFIKQEISDIKAATSTTVELKDFDDLKDRVGILEKHLALA